MSEPSLYAAFLDLENRPVLVVGGGSVAARKAGDLVDAGAEVTVVAPEATEEITAMADSEAIQRESRPYRSSDMDGAWLVIAATDDPELNRDVSRDAEAEGVFCNVVDRPRLCSYQVPATVRRGDLQLAISTRGSSPLLAGRLRRRLEDEFGPEYAALLDGMRDLRDEVKQAYPDDQQRRRRALEDFLESEVPARLFEDGDRGAFRRELQQWIKTNLEREQ